jgi:hypothetical protein
MMRTVQIAAKYPKGYTGPGLPPVDQVLARGARLERVGFRQALRFPPPFEELTLVDGERLTVAKIKAIREAWTSLAVNSVLSDARNRDGH